MSDSVQPHRRQPTRLPRPWDYPGKNTGVGCHFLLQCMKVKSESEVTQSRPTPSDPMDCSPPGSSVRGIFQARVLEWGVIAFSGFLISGLFYTVVVYVNATLSIRPTLSFTSLIHKSILQSVPLFLLCRWVHQCHFSRFHLYVLIYDICFSLFDLLHSV